MMRPIKRLLFLLLLLPVLANGQVITTFAGGGTLTPNGVPALSAHISNPGGGVFDSHGNYYFVEFSSISRVDKIDTSGMITIVAGTGTPGYNGDSIPATSATLNWPSAVIVDSLDNVFICDGQNSRIRKINMATGIISTIAGNGTPGYSGDSSFAVNAELFYPGNIFFDKQWNLFIANGNIHRLRKIDPGGIITTYAGNGTLGHSGDGGLASMAQISPSGLCVDDSNNLYVSDVISDESRIVKINALSSIVTTIAGTDTGYLYNGDSILAISANINPLQIKFDNAFSNLYFSDNVNNRIRRIDALGIIYTVAGTGIAGFSGDNGSALSAQLNSPTGIAFDKCGNLYFGDTYNGRIRKVTFDTSCSLGHESLSIKSISPRDITVSPNPATISLTITSPDKITQITITNLIGQTVYTQACNTEQVQVDVASFPAGMYFVKVNDNVVRKFVKE